MIYFRDSKARHKNGIIYTICRDYGSVVSAKSPYKVKLNDDTFTDKIILLKSNLEPTL